MSNVVNLYCVSSTNFQLVTKENATQNIDCFFIIADTITHKIYCYTKQELEIMYSKTHVKIEGIVFNIYDKICRWENHIDNNILLNVMDGLNTCSNRYNNFLVLDERYAIKRVLSNCSFITKCFRVSALFPLLTGNPTPSLPSLTLRDSTDITLNQFREEISKYDRISRICCTNKNLARINLENLDIRGIVHLGDSFAHMPALESVQLGRIELYNLDTVFHMITNSSNLKWVDFSQSVGDLNKNTLQSNSEIRQHFELAGHCKFNEPVIVYLNHESILFNNLLVRANPTFDMLTGLVPRSDMIHRARILLGRERLLKGEKEWKRGYFVRVDNAL